MLEIRIEIEYLSQTLLKSFIKAITKKTIIPQSIFN